MDSLFVKLVRAYGHAFPFERGKRRLASLAIKRARAAQHKQIVKAKDGRTFEVDLSDLMFLDLYFLGIYEPAVTAAVRRILRPGDVAFDLGASFGWFTTLFAQLVGPTGQVHAFEPLPPAHELLLRSIKRNGSPPWIRTNRLAVGDKEGVAQIHHFRGLTQGHSSISSLGRDDYVRYECDVTTLDLYLAEHAIDRVALIKCDVEGAEMAVLQGSRRLLSSKRKPNWILEVNVETSRALGFSPADLLSRLRRHGYSFFRLVGRRPSRLVDDKDYRHGDNILCVTQP